MRLMPSLHCASKAHVSLAREPIPSRGGKNPIKNALIIGATAQDGSYLAELLLEKGYELHGIIRRASTFIIGRIDQRCQDPLVNGVGLCSHSSTPRRRLRL